MIRKLLTFLGLVAVFGSLSFAQTIPTTSTIPTFYNAYGFAYGVQGGPAPLQVVSGSNGTGAYTITLAYGITSSAQGIAFSPLSTNVPITIGAGTSIETVTPSAVSCATPATYGTCTVTATFTFSHSTGDNVRSGDNGLGEAVIYANSHAGGLVAAGPDLQAALGGHAAVVTAITGTKGFTNTVVLDWTGYQNGTSAGALSYYAASNGSNYASTTRSVY